MCSGFMVEIKGSMAKEIKYMHELNYVLLFIVVAMLRVNLYGIYYSSKTPRTIETREYIRYMRMESKYTRIYVHEI